MFYLTREILSKKTDAQLRSLFAEALRRRANSSCRKAFYDASIRMIGEELSKREVSPR